jgi:hypothetical protein
MVGDGEAWREMVMVMMMDDLERDGGIRGVDEVESQGGGRERSRLLVDG